MAVLFGIVRNYKRGYLYAIRFKKIRQSVNHHRLRYSIVANQWIGGHHDLAGKRWIGKTFGIPGHGSIKNYFPYCFTEGTKRFAPEDFSILEGKELRQVVAVLQNPELKGDDLTYTVKVLQGEMPAKGADVSVFIDIIGMPLTPVSFAGVARRGYRRAVMFR